jgi:hypothetical protein
VAAEQLASTIVSEKDYVLPTPVTSDRRFSCLTLEEDHREYLFNGDVEIPINALYLLMP